MESSSRQSDILQKLEQIRRELAKKERKLQKLKRLSAHKRSLASNESSSIGPEETVSSIDTDRSSSQHTIEATLSQREICQSLRAVRPEDESFARAPESGARAGSAHLSSGESDQIEGSGPSSPGRDEVKLTAASAGEEAPTALPSRACQVPGYATSSCFRRPQRISALRPTSEAPDVLQTLSDASECFSPTFTSPQDKPKCRGQLFEFTSKRGSNDAGGDVSREGGTCTNEVTAQTMQRNRLIKDGSKCNAKSGSFTVSSEVNSAHNADHLESSPKEIFEDDELCSVSQDTGFSWRSQDGREGFSQVSTGQSTESTEVDTEARSPARKRQRTACEQTANSTKNYNFRKRRLSCASPPQERRRMSREAKTILGAFHKLVKQALELPVSMFQLHFEKLGLLQYLDTQGRPNHQAVDRNSIPDNSLRLHGCSDNTGASLLSESGMSVDGNTLSKAQKPQSFSSLEPASVAPLPLKGANIEALPSTPVSEKRPTRRSLRHCSLPSAPSLVDNTVQGGVTTETLSASEPRKKRAASMVDQPSSPVVHMSPGPVALCQDAASVCLTRESSGVCKDEDSCQWTEHQNSLPTVSGIKLPVAASNMSVFEEKDTVVEAASYSIEYANKGAVTIKTPEAPVEVKGASAGTEETQTHLSPVAYSSSGCCAQNSEEICAEGLKDRSSSVDGESLDGGEGVRSALFTQSEESDEGAMTDLVINVVEQLGSQEDGGKVNHTDQCGNDVASLSDSATPDDLDIPEMRASTLVPAPPALCGRREDSLPEELESGPETDLLCSLRARCEETALRGPTWPAGEDPSPTSQKGPCIAKRLDSSAPQVANSEAAELLDAQALEGMFDEWSEECGTETAGRCGLSSYKSHSSARGVAQRISGEEQAQGIHSEKSSQEHWPCKEEDRCDSLDPLYRSQMGSVAGKLECKPRHSLARTEAGKNDSLAHRHSPLSSSSQEVLSDEPEGRLTSEDIGRDEDCDRAEYTDTVGRCGMVLGRRNPLFFFCTLKCEKELPVVAVFLVRVEPHPFLVSVQASALSVWHLEHRTWRHSVAVPKLRIPVEEEQCCLLLQCCEWSVLAYLSPLLVPVHVPCVQWRTADGTNRVQLMLTLGSSSSNFSRRSLYRMAKLGREGWFATALRTARGATLLRVHRLRYMCGELGDETEPLGHTSNLLDSLVGVKGQPDALLGNSGNIFYVWDCQSRLLVKKMIHEPDMFTDLHHISWCCSDRGLLFVLMRSSDDVTSTLVAMNPFSCKAEVVSSSSWKLAAQARARDPRAFNVHVEGRYAACVGPGYGARIWNLFTGNPVADMWYHSSTSITMANVLRTTFVVIGSADGRILVFTS